MLYASFDLVVCVRVRLTRILRVLRPEPCSACAIAPRIRIATYRPAVSTRCDLSVLTYGATHRYGRPRGPRDPTPSAPSARARAVGALRRCAGAVPECPARAVPGCGRSPDARSRGGNGSPGARFTQLMSLTPCSTTCAVAVRPPACRSGEPRMRDGMFYVRKTKSLSTGAERRVCDRDAMCVCVHALRARRVVA